MKRKPRQVELKLRLAARTACKTLMAVLCSTFLAGPLPAHAASTDNIFKPSSVYLSCSRACPNCCKTPDVEIKNVFTGSDSKALNKWYLETLWPKIDQKIKAVTNKIVNGIVAESTKRGTMLDAQNNIRAITSLQKGVAQASRNYSSSEAMCRFATLTQGLVASQADADTIRQGFVKASISRQLFAEGTSAAVNTQAASNDSGKEGVTKGQSADRDARWKEYVSTFCNPADYTKGKAGEVVCDGSNAAQYNKDINFVATMANPLTLDITSEGTSTKDAQNIRALSQNLYAHDLINNMPDAAALDPNADGNYENIRKYMLLRSVIAKRSVAENSFTSLAAMKAKGSAATAEATKNLMIELGISKKQAEEFVGSNPSYYAQMEALTRKLYQSPAFLANLMESPVNVKRQQSSMKALELMQSRDIYKSIQRSEMLMATLLEIQLSRQQGNLDKQLAQSK